MTIYTKPAFGHNPLGLNQLDGHLGALARLLSLNATFEPEGEGSGARTEDPPASSRRAPVNGRGRDSHDDDDDDGDYDEVVENANGSRWRQPTAYEKRLRAEAAKTRKKLERQQADSDAEIARLTGELDKATKATKTAVDAALAERETAHKDALTAAEKAGNDRLIRFNLRAALKEAKCENIDDALKLIDGSAIQITEAGDVEGIEPLIEQLKKDKAYLFTKAPASTSKPDGAPPPNKEGEAKSAKDMTDEEYAAARAALTGSSRLRRR